MKMFIGMFIANMTTVLLFVYMFFFPYNKYMLTGLILISIVGYLASYEVISSTISKKCQQAYLDGVADGDKQSRNEVI